MAHIDLHQEALSSLEAEVAIIGAGAAGISVARRLLALGRSVLLLESGGIDYEPSTADLNHGSNVGEEYYPLQDTRLRMFGGTTAIWGGRCSEFEAIDFERRDWVPHSGWPLTIGELAPYYSQARSLLEVEAMDAEDLLQAGVRLPAFSPSELRVPVWTFDTRFDRFSLRRCRDVVDHPRCTVLTHATVREIRVQDAGITGLDVRTLRGRTLSVSAQAYLLAAGGIENARLLLASNSVRAAGLGNEHDQVGRYFMEHPHGRGGRVVDGAAWRLLSAFAKRRIDGMPVAPLIAASPELQARKGILNTSLTIVPRRPASGREALAMRAYLKAKHRIAPTKKGRALWKSAKSAVGWLQMYSDPLRPWLLNKAGQLDVALLLRAEQAPNPDNRVRLAQERDQIGMPRVLLDWRTSAIDVRSARELVSAVGRELRRLDLGTVEPAEWLSDEARSWRTDPLISAHSIGGYHHMGTTRMSADPKSGVTDQWGKVHDVGNLYVAGSSLFPTSGWANPTLTIVALALRTADRLNEALSYRP